MADVAYSEAVMENNFVTKDAFDIQVRSIRERADSEVRVSDARFDRLEALMAKMLGEIKMDNAQFRSEIKSEIKSMKDRMGRMEGELDRVKKSVDLLKEDNSNIRGDIKALDAKIYALDGRLSQNLTITGIIVAVFSVITTVAVAAIQLWK